MCWLVGALLIKRVRLLIIPRSHGCPPSGGVAQVLRDVAFDVFLQALYLGLLPGTLMNERHHNSLVELKVFECSGVGGLRNESASGRRKPILNVGPGAVSAVRKGGRIQASRARIQQCPVESRSAGRWGSIERFSPI